MKYLKIDKCEAFNRRLSELALARNMEPPPAQNTLDLLEVMVNGMPSGGFDPATMKKRLRLMDVIEQARSNGAADQVGFEDADFEELKACAKSAKWTMLSSDIVALSDEIEAGGSGS
ncbi:MAG: hypothetical protein KKB20_27400 [Proteobacteria bacterium]|nr:hypothetical protein [Pseudomonadota bacterium]